MKTFLTLFLTVFSLTVAAQKFENLAKTPPMGWNSWNKFACNVSEDLLKNMADAMASSGMRAAGYEYIVIDDCWHGKRDSLGFIHPNPEHFPSGMKAVADYIHSKGLKFGIYSCAGNKTCAGHSGSRGHEYQDAITYASWGVDYLKYDWCNTDGLTTIGAYTTMRDALYSAGRPVVFSLCEWGNSKPWEWGKNVGHLWRTTGDIYNVFDGEVNHGTWSSWGVMKILDMQKGLEKYAGPGHWNDPDMLEVGNGMPVNEDRAHFSMWCMLAAPLIAGNDLATMSKETHDILTNMDVIALDQDTLGIQGFQFSTIGDSIQVFAKPLAGGDLAVAFLNRSKKSQVISFDWQATAIENEGTGTKLVLKEKLYSIRDLWTKKNLGTTAKVLKTEVPSHDVLLVRLTGK
ncbi:MAG: glycoside hydrolase family 27 protein [Bacteroidetes bacterium]|nr:glycoside hydrolase family 27 protein [Bacteroidota bacterium]